MSIVAAWNFDNVSEGAVVYDDQGNHNGSVIGSVPLVPGPVSSKGRQFDGNTSTNRIVIPAHADFGFHHDLTVEALVSVGSLGSRRAVSKGNASQDVFYMGTHLTAGWLFHYRPWTSGTGKNLFTNVIPVAGELAHIAMTWDLSEQFARAYVHGSLVAEDTISGTHDQDPRDLCFGGREDATGGWDGQIHAVRWWDEVVTQKAMYDLVHGSDIKEAPHL